MGRVCVFFAEGYEEIEALTVVDLVRRVGIDTDMVSVTGEKTVTGSHGISVEMDRLYAEVDMLVLPGGMPGTVHLEAYAPLMEQVDDFYAKGKYVAAICAAPSILGHRGMLKGKKACSYPDKEKELEGAEVTKSSVEIADNLITSRGMGCAIDFGLAIVAVLKGQEEADALAEKIVYEA